MPSVERLSFQDDTLLGGYAECIDRLAFAAPHCVGKRVIDAACGTGLGVRYLLDHGANYVLGIDYSDEAIREARSLQASQASGFVVGDLHELAGAVEGQGSFGAMVCFDALPHLSEPARFLAAAARCLGPPGTFIVGTPNRDAVALDSAGRPTYRFQHTAYTAATLEALLRAHFPDVSIWGQWLTPSGKLRKRRTDEQFRYICDSYYQPAARLGRWAKRLLGRRVLPPPDNHATADAYPGDYEIAPIQSMRQPWVPTSLIAICRN